MATSNVAHTESMLRDRSVATDAALAPLSSTEICVSNQPPRAPLFPFSSSDVLAPWRFVPSSSALPSDSTWHRFSGDATCARVTHHITT